MIDVRDAPYVYLLRASGTERTRSGGSMSR